MDCGEKSDVHANAGLGSGPINWRKTRMAASSPLLDRTLAQKPPEAFPPESGPLYEPSPRRFLECLVAR